ncbi:MAG: nucleotide sugar dehydrogenase [Hyphomicrobiales bacterium]|nr:nucleotide sugar dehydrogenase [Hyphomicrobiales bacterium]
MISLPVEFSALERRLTSRDAHIGIIGMGYVGMPLMLAATAAGFSVLGFDIDEPKVEALNRGISPLRHFGDDRVAAALADGRFSATADFARLSEPDAILICVPTPLGPHREPDLSFVEQTARSIAETLRPGQLIVLESSTWPGTTREVVKPLLETSGLRSGTDFFLAYSPEREDPGNRNFDTSCIPRVIGGDGETAGRLARTLYGQFVSGTVPVSSPETAEAVKLTENIFRAVNIALVNELKIVFHAMGIDVFEVINAAKTKPFGYMPFYPGPGLGGHCIPIDPFYLTWKAREYGIATRFIELAGEVNNAMPRYVVERAAEALDRCCGKGLKGANILVIGIAYKKNIDDVRESPGLAIIQRLEARGAHVVFHDPHVPVIPKTREHSRLAGRESQPLTAKTVTGTDMVLIITDHDSIDWDMIATYAPLIVDTRHRITTGSNLEPA